MTNEVERRVELTLPLIPDIEIAVIKAASDLAREIGMSSDQTDELSHAIVEACINAREHSSCADQRIYLRFIGSQDAVGRPKMDIWITDHGKGFDPDKVRRDRSMRPATPRKRGWGLQIIEAHMDEVEISSGDTGTTIHMVKYGGKK